MKKPVKILAYLVFLVLISACGSTNRMTMGVTEPAIVHLSSDVKRVGIINRSLPSEGNATLDKIDKILSAEGMNLDKKGSEAAISSLSSELSVIKSFEEIKIIEGVEEIKKGLNVFPATLSWDIVEKLCKENNVDVIFSLAYYDTDTKTDYKVITMKLPNNLGVDVDVPAQEVTLNTQVNCGWRLYDPHTKEVVDTRKFTKNMVFRGKGINPMKAIEAVADRNETVQEYSRNVGIAYAKRLIPRNVRVSREYFMSGTDNFKISHRRAVAGDWDGAAELWEKELSNPDIKIAGRANYNMAISSEINGDLDKAIEYASKSYTDYENNMAIDYVKILRYRVKQNNILNQQRTN
ncbi:DUF6340 family protein [uncultured Maribacter sp.]|uniref:DUF6340 family protein n=1 Tax=uncultured Maribacter sp. TaxID=431308 RepID=UPI002618B902|nr:DUF6340 family protein [uncultured Maribacter sp.]